MSAIVSLLWPKNDGVIREYLSQAPSHVYVPWHTDRFISAPGALSVKNMFDVVSAERRDALTQEAVRRATAIVEEVRVLGGDGVAANFADGLERRLAEVALSAEALDRIHAADGIDLIVLSEDVMALSKSTTDWGRAHGVPSVVVSHSMVNGRPYTVHEGLWADGLTVFGPRGGTAYVNIGISPDRIAVTGNPAWDKYPALIANKNALREQLRKQLGVAGDAPVVLFTTTWNDFRTTFEEPDENQSSLRSFFRAGKQLRNAGVNASLLVKDRESNKEMTAMVRSWAQEEGVPDVQIYVENLPELIIASDIVISPYSNVTIEAMIAGVPAVNLWNPWDACYHSMYNGSDGVLDASPEHLASAIATILTNPAVRATLLEQARAFLPELAANLGSAAQQTAQALLRIRKPADGAARHYAWQSLSGSQNAATQIARNDLAPLLLNTPSVAVVFGSAAASAAIARSLPNAKIVGIEPGEVTTFDFAAAGLGTGAVDAVFFPDSLSQLYDPWGVLSGIKPLLASGAHVLASIPNVRNFWLLSELLRGRWDYASDGLLDIKNVRFFSRKGVEELFSQTGYRIEKWASNIDVRVPEMNAVPGQVVDITTPTMVLKQLTHTDLEEFRVLQFLVTAVAL